MELQDKKYRILDIFFRLLKGEFVSSKELLVLIEILIASRSFDERQYGRNMITVCKVIHPLVMKQKRMSDFGTHINSFSFVSQACLPSFLWYQFFLISSGDISAFRTSSMASVSLSVKFMPFWDA